MSNVKGKLLDDQTRCEHYHSAVDVIAIRFYCCLDYYPCYQCHEELAGHKAMRWPRNQWDQKAILCGVCKHELTIREYMQSNNTCPSCSAAFNPGCSLHYHLYFETGIPGEQVEK